MLPVVYAWIGARAGWRDGYITMVFILSAVLLTAAFALALINPGGFKTVGLWVLGFIVFALLLSLFGALGDWADQKERVRRPSGQMKLLEHDHSFSYFFRHRVRFLVSELAFIGLLGGLVSALLGE